MTLERAVRTSPWFGRPKGGGSKQTPYVSKKHIRIISDN